MHGCWKQFPLFSYLFSTLTAVSSNAEARQKIALVILSSFLLSGKTSVIFYRLTVDCLAISVEILVVSDFKSIKPRLKSQVL